MFTILKTEFLKIKRYHIMLIGLIGMFCSPLLQLFSQSVMAEEYKNTHYDVAALIDATIWGNATIFLPVIITLTGGYLINREYIDDTLKNILTVPVLFRKFMTGKLAAIGLLSIIFGVYSFIVTVFTGIFARLGGNSILVWSKGLLQMIGLSVFVYIVVLPIIIVCSRRQGMFMSGSVIAFLTGYCCMFFKEGLLRNIYPFSAALTMIGYDTASWAGTKEKGSIPLAILSLTILLLISVALVGIFGQPGELHTSKKQKKHKRGSRPAQRRR